MRIVTNWLTDALAASGLSVAELARRSGVSRATIFRLLADPDGGSTRKIEALRKVLGEPASTAVTIEIRATLPADAAAKVLALISQAQSGGA